MRKLVASMAFVAAALYGATAKAATVDVHVIACASAAGCSVSEPGQPTLSLNMNDLAFINDHAGQTVGNVSLHLDPAAGSLFTPTGIVSVADSVLSGEFIIVSAAAGSPFNQTTGLTGGFILGNFTGAHLTPCADAGGASDPLSCGPANGLYQDAAAFGSTVLDGALATAVTNDFRIVPEPASVVLLGIAAAGLALVRRKA